MKKWTLVGLILPALLAVPQVSGGKENPIIAVFDVEDRGSGLGEPVMTVLTVYLCARMTAVGYQVIPRSDILERLRGQKKDSYKSCYDQKCQIELGRELAAQMSLSTQVMRVGDSCQLAGVLFDLKKATAVQAVTKEAPCQDHELLKAVKAMAGEFGKQLEGEQISKVLEDVVQGTLVVQTEPGGAQVLIDGEASGVSPFTTQLKGGSYRVRVIRNGYAPVEKEVKVETGQKATVSFPLVALSPGTLEVKTEPAGASVTLNGQLIGTTPVTKELKAGDYNLSLSKDGHLDTLQKVRLDWGKVTRSELELAATPSHSMWGHIAFWSGLGMAAISTFTGFQARKEAEDFRYSGLSEHADNSRLLAGTMYATSITGALLMIGGVVLWLIAPDAAVETAPPAGPRPGGPGVSLGGRW